MAASTPAQASPWAQNSGYLSKTGGKFKFGLKHTLFSWLFIWTEANEKEYKKQWEGLSAGVGKTFVYTAAGLLQLATFPVPVDVPDIGIGLHIPNKKCPGRHNLNAKTAEPATAADPETKEPVSTPAPELEPAG